MNQKNHGFTLIEVSLVFGLAAAIFLMAFIALPSLWISQRDAQRKANVMELISDLKIYQTNNSRGALPTLPTGNSNDFTLYTAQTETPAPADGTWKYFVRNYVAKDFADPDMTDNGSNLHFTIYNCSPATAGSPCNNTKNNTDVSPAFDKKAIYIYIFTAATCNGDHAVRANSERSAAAIQVLERGGRYCHST